MAAPHSTTSTIPFSAASLAVIEQRPTWQYQWAMCPLQSSLPLPPTSWFKLHHSLKIPHTFWGGIHPKQLNMLYLSLEFLGIWKKLLNIVELLCPHPAKLSPLHGICMINHLPWSNFPLPSEPLCFGLPSGTVPLHNPWVFSFPEATLSCTAMRSGTQQNRPRHSKRCQENANGDCKHTDKLLLAIQDPKGQKIQKLVCTAKAAQDTQVQSESLRKSVGQIPGNPAEQWQWYYRNESLLKSVHWSKTIFFWGVTATGYLILLGTRGGWHNQSLWHALPQSDSIYQSSGWIVLLRIGGTYHNTYIYMIGGTLAQAKERLPQPNQRYWNSTTCISYSLK